MWYVSDKPTRACGRRSGPVQTRQPPEPSATPATPGQQQASGTVEPAASFQRALRVAKSAGLERAKVVHGTIGGHPQGWVAVGDLVFDCTLEAPHPERRKQWAQRYSARPEATYSLDDAMRIASEAESPGPWHRRVEGRTRYGPSWVVVAPTYTWGFAEGNAAVLVQGVWRIQRALQGDWRGKAKGKCLSELERLLAAASSA